jgi:hypothetical protein
MDYRIALIRCVILCTLGIVLCGIDWFYLGSSCLVIGLFMPVFSTVVDCSNCNTGTTHNAAQAVISGFANNLCTNCSLWDGTYELRQSTFPSPGNPCIWDNSYVGGTPMPHLSGAGSCSIGILILFLSSSPSPGRYSLTVSSGFSNDENSSNKTISTPTDCGVDPGSFTGWTNDNTPRSCDANSVSATVTWL